VTGTNGAETPDPNDPRTSKDRYLSSIMGFVKARMQLLAQDQSITQTILGESLLQIQFEALASCLFDVGILDQDKFYERVAERASENIKVIHELLSKPKIMIADPSTKVH
jgi:hypothetical protein